MHGIRGTNRNNRIVTLSGPYNGNEKPSANNLTNFNNGNNSKLYVGNLAWDVTWQNLKDYMRTAGRVSTADVMEDSEGKSKGYGLVTFVSAEDAEQAIIKLNNTELNGRKISIREDRNPQPENYGNNSVQHKEGDFATNKVYVGNLSFNVTWQDLKDHMRTTGDRVLTADVVTTPDGRSRGYGLVTFVTPREAAHAAASLSESELQGRKIFVREDRDGARNEQKSAPLSDGNGRHHSANCKVYVGNLAWDVSWQDLKDHMRTAGGRVITADVAMESADNSRSKGFGLVTFASAQDAEEAIARLNDSDLKGRKIFVREDRENGSNHQQEVNRQHHDGDYRGRGVQQQQHHQQNQEVEEVPSATVYVGNLAWDVTWQDLEEHMKRGGGQVVKAEVLREDSGRSKGCGLVEFGSVDEASHAISVLNESEFNGRKIFVRFDREQAGNRGEHSKPFVQHGVEYKLFVGQLAWAVRWQELKDHFKQAGLAVTHADVQREVRGDDNSRSRGFGFVSFETREEAERAVSVLHGSTLLDRQIVVREDQPAQSQEHRN